MLIFLRLNFKPNLLNSWPQHGSSLTPEMQIQLSNLSVLIQPLLVDFVNDDYEHDMDVELSKVLKVGQKFFHEYDFGSTTKLALKVVAERERIAPNDDDKYSGEFGGENRLRSSRVITRLKYPAASVENPLPRSLRDIITLKMVHCVMYVPGPV